MSNYRDIYKKRERQIALSLSVGGGYLLSHFRSTIGVAGFNFSVRNGKRWIPRAVTAFVTCSELALLFLPSAFASVSAFASTFRFCVCFSACSRAPFAAGPFRMARKRALGFCRKAVHRLATMTKTLSGFFAFRFTFQDFARKLTCLLGRVPRLWTRLVALGPAPARLSRLPSSRSSFFGGLLPGKGSGY